MRRTTVRHANTAQSISGSHYGQYNAHDGAGIWTPGWRQCRMYREDSVERTLMLACTYCVRCVSVCGKTARGAKLFFVVVLCFRHSCGCDGRKAGEEMSFIFSPARL